MLLAFIIGGMYCVMPEIHSVLLAIVWPLAEPMQVVNCKQLM